jgi:uncharacterized RDD family membrane protein YckC
MKPLPPTGPSEFYLRKRRLAMVFAGVSVSLLLVSVLMNFSLETFARPRVAADADRLRFVWEVTVHAEEAPATRMLETDLDLRPAGKAARLEGNASAVLADGDETLLFFGPHYTLVKAGTTVRGAALDQVWRVDAAIRDPGRKADWIFGVHAGKILARRRELGTFSEPQVVADSSTADRIVASVDGTAGPLVAWRERGSGTVKTALYDGRGFVPRGEFRIGPVALWDVALCGPRVLLVTYHREDKTFSSVGLRLSCCEGCPNPRPPETFRFPDPHLFLGKVVGGVAVAAAGDRLAVFLTRWTVAQAATAALDVPGGAPTPLTVIHQVPGWQTFLTGVLLPVSMLFFSFSLVFLGYTLLRERSQFVLEKLTPVATEGPAPAAILQRAMAFILDLLILLPLFGLLFLLYDLSPDMDVDPSDPAYWMMAGALSGLQIVYGAVMEGLFGWTVGKKIIGIRSVAQDGSRLGLRGAVLRNVARVVDASFPLGMFVGMSLIMASRRRQRLGDLLGRTLVVEDRPRPDRGPRPARELAGTRDR